MDLGEDAHPNTAIFERARGRGRTTVRGASRGRRAGGGDRDGRIPRVLGGDYHTLVLLAHDEPGTIATVAGLFAGTG